MLHSYEIDLTAIPADELARREDVCCGAKHGEDEITGELIRFETPRQRVAWLRWVKSQRGT